jgi:hypothetical protein
MGNCHPPKDTRRQRSHFIDGQISNDCHKSKQVVSIVLLGAGEVCQLVLKRFVDSVVFVKSGKSTIFKHYRKLYGKGPSGTFIQKAELFTAEIFGSLFFN